MKKILITIVGVAILVVPVAAMALSPPTGGGPVGRSPEPLGLWLMIAGSVPAMLLYAWSRRRVRATAQ
jgi:divalent metal cation (Fe/Co/Zn/Cd) transporter